MDKVIILLDDSEESSSPAYLSKLISMGIYNFTKNVEGIMYLYNNPNSYRDVAHIQQLEQPVIVQETQVTSGVPEVPVQRIIGVKNVTKQAGATTLLYMMYTQLVKNYSVACVEVGKSDFRYFNNRALISTSNSEIGNTIVKNSDKDIILIDVNDSTSAEGMCTEMIYLIEPSIIKLNRLMLISPNSLKNLKDKKVILNQSLLSSKDVLDFEYESKMKIFYNMPPLDEREKDIQALNAFLVRLGFSRQKSSEQEKKGKILGIFGF